MILDVDIWTVSDFPTGDYGQRSRVLGYFRGTREQVTRYAETLKGFRGIDVGGTEVTGSVSKLRVVTLDDDTVEKAYNTIQEQRRLESELNRIKKELERIKKLHDPDAGWG